MVPSVLADESLATEDRIDEVIKAVEVYKDDLLSYDTLPQELTMWQKKSKMMDEEDLPKTAMKALKLCDLVLYPNIHTLLRIICTLPVTSCECERSDSALRRLHAYCRACMTQKV